jgi:hypothetical protein
MCQTIARENEDGTYTCINCGFVFNPYYTIDENAEALVEKMVKKVNGLRSCIVTLDNGRDVTFSFPKELEPEHADETYKAIWRNEIRAHLAYLIITSFPPQSIARSVFDDEV